MGITGAFPTLEAMVQHHLNPAASFASWKPEMASLPKVAWLAGGDFLSFDDIFERARLSARHELPSVKISNEEVAQIVAFLHSLTGTQSIKGRFGRPDAVPSGLEVD